MKIDTNLSWQYHVNDPSIKLNRAKALPFVMGKYVSFKTLKFIYFPFLTPTYPTAPLSGFRILALFNGILILQKTILELLIFNQRNSPINPLFEESSILKFQDNFL